MDRNTILFAGQLLADVFGAGSPVYIPWGKRREYGASPFENVVLVEDSEAERLSWMGTPVVGSFSLMAGKYGTYRHGQLDNVEMPDFVMPYASLVTFSRAMNMTQTKILGASGSVKEIYGLDDWEITVQGICITDSERVSCKTAEEQVEELVRWRNVTDTINVSGQLFTKKDIYAICIKNLTISPQQGKPGAIPFTIEAVSDNPIELIL